MTIKETPTTSKIYLSGKMSGIKNFNRDYFNKVAEKLRLTGREIYNPAEIIGPPEWSWADYMRRALELMMHCDTIYVLQGYESSRGAKIEIALAKELEMTIIYEESVVV